MGFIDLINWFVDVVLHLDTHLTGLVDSFGLFAYLILFLIIFAETGLVVTPFLPGDSLLFALGALAATGYLNISILLALLIIAAILGDTVNYWAGRKVGPEFLKKKKVRFIKKEHIERTERFFEKYGAKTIILARFVPIVRTFAPFLAGIGSMHYPRFLLYNIIGGIVWISSFLLLGYFFGNIPLVKENFGFAIIAIIILSFIPIAIEFYKARKSRKAIV